MKASRRASAGRRWPKPASDAGKPPNRVNRHVMLSPQGWRSTLIVTLHGFKMQKAPILSGVFLVLQSEMYKIPIGRLSVLFFGLSEDKETAQVTDIEARVRLTCPGERNASITDGSP